MDTDDVSASQEFIAVNSIETLAGEDESTNISPQLVERLRDAGYRSLQSIVVLGTQQISHDIHIGLESSQRICGLASMKLNSARKIEGLSGTSPSQFSPMNHIKTGSKALDYYLGGGIELGAVTEFFGKSASGKTQLCHTISVTAHISRFKYMSRSINEDKLNKVVYIDTEGTFRSQRINQIALARGLKAQEVINNVILLECYSIFDQEQCLKYMCELLDKDKSISLIIIDSVIVHFREEYPGRSMLPERQQRLNKYLSALSKIARIYKVAVVITNQVQSIPSDTMFLSEANRASGGNIVSHISTHRIRLNKPGSESIYAKIVKSPYHPSSAVDVRFIISSNGIDDLDDEVNLLVQADQDTTSITRSS